VRKCKRSIASILPRFNMNRVLKEYWTELYSPASAHGMALAAADFRGARELAQWRRRVAAAWPNVGLRRLDASPARIRFGDRVEVSVAVQLAGLNPEDVVVELTLSRRGAVREGPVSEGASAVELARESGLQDDEITVSERLTPTDDALEHGSRRFALALRPEWCGRLGFRVRVFPYHPLLAHPHETGLMKWL
jgi:starch phosphorylase